MGTTETKADMALRLGRELEAAGQRAAKAEAAVAALSDRLASLEAAAEAAAQRETQRALLAKLEQRPAAEPAASSSTLELLLRSQLEQAASDRKVLLEVLRERREGPELGELVELAAQLSGVGDGSKSIGDALSELGAVFLGAAGAGSSE